MQSSCELRANCQKQLSEDCQAGSQPISTIWEHLHICKGEKHKERGRNSTQEDDDRNSLGSSLSINSSLLEAHILEQRRKSVLRKRRANLSPCTQSVRHSGCISKARPPRPPWKHQTTLWCVFLTLPCCKWWPAFPLYFQKIFYLVL